VVTLISCGWRDVGFVVPQMSFYFGKVNMEVAWQKKLNDIRRVGKHDSFNDTESMYD